MFSLSACLLNKSILEGLDKSHEKYQNKKFWVFVGARYQEDLFWEPNFKNLKIKYIPVLTRQDNDWHGAKGYVQEIALKQQIDLENTQVYACGSNDIINSANRYADITSKREVEANPYGVARTKFEYQRILDQEKDARAAKLALLKQQMEDEKNSGLSPPWDLSIQGK